MVKGFITMSARPFHKGHEALIEYAKENCDHLTILITTLPDEVIPYKHRLLWVLSQYLHDPKVTIMGLDVKEPEGLSYDDLSKWWGFFVRLKVGKFDRVFTSEPYGEEFAAAMGAEHWCFDTARTKIDIRATDIRERPLTNWDFINNFAKDYFVKKIAIVGTESTGKTVMAERLARRFNTAWCPEIGRDLVRSSTEVTRDDIMRIASEHAKSIVRHTRLSNRVLIVDTEVSITASYHEFLFGEKFKIEPWIENVNFFDLYIYLDPSAPYVDDGTRLEEDARNKLADSHVKTLTERGLVLNRFSFDTSIPTEEAYDKRFDEVVKFIQAYIDRY